jgi:hypothetical protein
MNQYQYRCPSCRNIFTVLERADVYPCPTCGRDGSRKFQFSVKSSFQEHFNHAVGHYVNNQTQFYDSLKVQSDEMSYRMGTDVDYQPISAMDMAEGSAHGVTSEGLEETYKAHHDLRKQYE